MSTSEKIAKLSRWIDESPGYANLGAELHARRRIDKLMEEVGEVGEALGGWFAENPRKGRTHSGDDVLAELLDVMVTAAGAFESLTGNRGIVVERLDEHMTKLLGRAGLESSDSTPGDSERSTS